MKGTCEMTEDEIREAVIEDDVNTCLNDTQYLRELIGWAFRDHTPEMFLKEYNDRELDIWRTA